MAPEDLSELAHTLTFDLQQTINSAEFAKDGQIVVSAQDFINLKRALCRVAQEGLRLELRLVDLQK